MKLSETAVALALVQSFDRRTVGEQDVIAWQSILGDIALEDAQEAIRRHYAASADWMMPAHIRRLVGEIEMERQRASRRWAPGQAGVRAEEALPEVSGPIGPQELSESVRELLSRLRTMLPEGSREDLMPRRAAWEREHKAFLRTQSSEPNPLYKPTSEKVATGPDTGILPNAYRCGDCAFTTAALDRWDMHEVRTGHQHEGS